jgi:hypothetical protein
VAYRYHTPPTFLRAKTQGGKDAVYITNLGYLLGSY